MSTLLNDVLTLIQSSPTLQAYPQEQWLWSATAKTLDASGLSKLKAILENEFKETVRIKTDHKARGAKIDAAQLAELKAFKQGALAQFVKKWEAAQTAKENPDALLKQLRDV